MTSRIIHHDASITRRAVVLIAGLVLVAAGVACCIRAEVGVAPYDVLTTGIAARFGVPVGVAAILLPVVFLAIGTALGGRLGPGSILAVALVGPMLGSFLSVVPQVQGVAARVGLFSGGFTLITLGITAMLIADMGSGPVELVMLALHDRGHPLAPARTGIELTTVALGWALGGQIGAGTAVFAVLIGPALRIALGAAGYGPTEAAEASDRAAPGV